MLRLPGLVEKVFVVITLILSTTAFIPVLLDSGDASRDPTDPYSPVVFMSIYTVTLILILAWRRVFLHVAMKDLLIWVLIGIALASVFWTATPDITPRRCVLLLGTTLFGVYLATRFSFREQLELLAWAFGTIIVFSFVFALALPFYGIMSTQEGGAHVGAWRGVMSHKNLLGRLMNLSAIVFILLAMSKRSPRACFLVGYILTVALILLCTSKTALVVFLTLIAILPLYRSLRWKSNQLAPLLITLILVGGGAAVLLVDNLGSVASSLGKDLTLTGRTEIWSVMLEMLWKRPLLGYGFNGFWQGWDSEVSAYVWRTLAWECPYGHNGFMDLSVELGLLGLTVFLLSYLTAYVRAISWLRIITTVEGLWPVMYLTYFVLYNITESALLSTNSISWILYVSIVFSMAVEYDQVQKILYASKMSGKQVLLGVFTDEKEWLESEAANRQN